MSASLSVLALVSSLAGSVGGPLAHVPDHAALTAYHPPETTRVYAADGQLIREYFVENRLVVPLSTLPSYLVQAFISAEDQHFREHLGVDPRGLARAVVANLRNLAQGRRLEGGSTITQQVAKNLLLTDEVSVLRKLREMVVALEIERDLTKDQIIEIYLNEIYLGRGAYGVGAAAARYFGKPPTDLTLSEAAFLAGLPKAPSNYNPITHPEAAMARRDYVIGRMLEDGAITQEQATAALGESLAVRPQAALETVSAPYFSEEVRRTLWRDVGSQALYRGGLSVRTTLDPRLQALADQALRNGLMKYDRNLGWRGPITSIATMLDLVEQAEAAAPAIEPTPVPEPEAAPAEGTSSRLLGALSALGVRMPSRGSAAPAAGTEDVEPEDTRPLWQRYLVEMDRPKGGGQWLLAVVLEAERQSAAIGLEDGSRGRLDRDDVRWARRLDKGDVIWVERAPGTPVEGELAVYGLRQIPEVSGAIVAMDPRTGRVLAMTGGFDFGLSEFNRVTQAARQPGSAFKPFVYLAALENGFTPTTVLYDLPFAVDRGPDEAAWVPQNYGSDFIGAAPLRVGVERSRNVMTVRLLMDLGLGPVKHVAETLGIYDDMPMLPSMALGAGETTPLRLTTAYAMIANGGHRITPYLIERVQDRQGTTLMHGGPERCDGCAGEAWWDGEAAPEMPIGEQLVDPVADYQMITILEGVIQRGTATALRPLGLPLAGKTGTTNDSNDVWFVGFSPNLAVGVYIGYDTPRSLGARATGGGLAVPVFGEFMSAALNGRDPGTFPIPAGVEMAYVDRRTGYAASGGEDAILEVYRPGTGPSTAPIADSSSFGSQSYGSALAGTGGLY